MELSAADIDAAANLLVNNYNVSSQLLGQLIGTEHRDDANEILQMLGRRRLSRFDIAKIFIKRHGIRLFSGSSEDVRRLRLHMLTIRSSDAANEITALFRRHEPRSNNINTVGRMLKPLSEKNWHDGGPWARDFVQFLGFPHVFAGRAERQKVSVVEDVAPLNIPPKLVDFQEDLKERMLEVLNRDGDKTRCIVTLPTGAGKTRVAVEAFIDWLHPRFNEGKYLLWIAQSEELCEQAISCIRQMWSSREFISPLRIYRYFRGSKINLDDLQGGVVVASIQQLYSRVKNNDDVIVEMIKSTGAMIIDEAHYAVTSMYNETIKFARSLCKRDLFPICGLTATPGRVGQNQTESLVGQFEAYLVRPNLPTAYNNNPLHYFRHHKFLASARHTVVQSGRVYTLTDREVEMLQMEDDVPKIFLKRLAEDKARNLHIIRELLKRPTGSPTLVYACSVDHAYFLTSVLNELGRTSGTVSAETPNQVRRQLIKDFNQGQVNFLCNFGVLTTGFDAPKTECIVICRPTTSVVLYEQIVGRGLRGPKFGGTETCDVIDFADNINRLGPPLAYFRFNDFWG